jgi:hypothetical protein
MLILVIIMMFLSAFLIAYFNDFKCCKSWTLVIRYCDDFCLTLHIDSIIFQTVMDSQLLYLRVFEITVDRWITAQVVGVVILNG